MSGHSDSPDPCDDLASEFLHLDHRHRTFQIFEMNMPVAVQFGDIVTQSFLEQPAPLAGDVVKELPRAVGVGLILLESLLHVVMRSLYVAEVEERRELILPGSSLSPLGLLAPLLKRSSWQIVLNRPALEL